MPSTIVSIDETRSGSVRPAQGLRYGNFEGIRNLPPLRKSQDLSERSYWTINNDQICSTVCQWMETWQPWQQKTLLCGVANRCSVTQLEIFSTILEPLNHRDYKTQCLMRYPSASFKVNKKPKDKNEGVKDEKMTRQRRKIASSQSYDTASTQSHKTASSQSKKSKKIPLIVTDDVGNVTDLRTVTEYLEHDMKSDKGSIQQPQKAQEDTTAKDKSELLKVDQKEDDRAETPAMELSEVAMGVDQYLSILSSSILISALNEAATYSVLDKNQFSSSREVSTASSGKVKIEEPIESKDKSAKSEETHMGKRDNVQESEQMGQRENTWHSCKSSASILKSRPMTRSSQASSTKFLGGTLEFLSHPHDNKKLRRECSSSGKFRHSAFAPSSARTSDFFNKAKLIKLGPMQNTLRTGVVQRPQYVDPVPVSLQRSFKHARWWPSQPPQGSVFHQAHKLELSLNFNEQLSTIWKWLAEWENYEQMAFFKRVAMMCSASVLDALLTHIQQRLRDARDINRLPDKLLLYVFSFLTPHDILQAAKVCRRWRFLCAMDDLWMLKCLEIGEQGGVTNIAELVEKAKSGNLSESISQGENRVCRSKGDSSDAVSSVHDSVLLGHSVSGDGPVSDATVDWMLACSQLLGLLRLREKENRENEETEQEADLIATLPEETADPAPVSSDKGKSKGSVRIQLNTGVREKLAQRKKGSRHAKSLADDRDGIFKSERVIYSPSKTVDSAYGGSLSYSYFSEGITKDECDEEEEEEEEDLADLMEEYNILRGPDSIPGPQLSRTPRRSELISRTTTRPTGQPETLFEEPETTERHSTPATSIGKSRLSCVSTKKSPEKKEEEKDTGLDIRTNLTQSRDLLGKLTSKTSLEWETSESYNDYMRTTLFAGELTAVKRMRKLQGHVNSIICLQFDRRRLVTCGLDRVARLWDVRSGRALHKFYGHKGGIRCVQFDNDIMATGSWDCLILIWDMRQFTNIHTLQGHADSVTCLEFNGDFLVSGSDDRSVRLWRRPTFLCMMTITFDAPVLSLVIVDHNFIVSTSDLGVYMLDAYTGTKRSRFQPPLGPVHTLSVHGKLMVGGDSRGRFFFWSLDQGELEAAVQGHDDAVTRVRLQDGRFFSSSCDGSIKEWDLRTMTCLRVLKGHRGPVRDVQVSERRIISCGDDTTTRIWDLVLGESKPATKEDEQGV